MRVVVQLGVLEFGLGSDSDRHAAVLTAASAAMASVREAFERERVGGHVGRRLHVVQARQHLALLYLIAFLDVEVVILAKALAPMLT